MAKADAKFLPPVPMDPELDSVTLHLSAQEAKDLAVVLGRTIPSNGYGTSITVIYGALWDAGINSDKLGADERYEDLPGTIRLSND